MVIHGIDPKSLEHHGMEMDSQLTLNKQAMMQHNIQLVDALERHGTAARPFFCTASILNVEQPNVQHGYVRTFLGHAL